MQSYSQPQKRQALEISDDDQSSCRICGHDVASWHYGAVVCEACKKFFVRSHVEERHSRYVCVEDSDACEITVQKRSNCQRCRMLKCIRVGMSMKRVANSGIFTEFSPADMSIDSFIKDVDCKVCHSRASGIHFGVITCEACKAFFRRAVKKNQYLTYRCFAFNACQIASNSRSCRSCRFNKCIQMGMSGENSKVGRKPSVIKQQLYLTSCKQREEYDEGIITNQDENHSHKRYEETNMTNDKHAHMPESKRVRIDEDVFSPNNSTSTSSTDNSPVYSMQNYYQWPQHYHEALLSYGNKYHPHFYSNNFYQPTWSNSTA